MNRAMQAIIKKDFQSIASNRRLFTSLLVVPLVLTIFLPSVFVLTAYFVPDDPRQRPKHIRPGDNDLLSDSYQEIRISVQERMNELKVLYDHHFPIPGSLQNGICQHMHLGKGRLKTDIQVVCMGRKGI